MLRHSPELPFTTLKLLLSAAIAALLIAKFFLLYRLNINWDEFFFASKIYVYERGELTTSIQSFHVHLFGWLKSIRGDGIDQIIAARESMFALRIVSCFCVFAIGRALYGSTGALVAVFFSLAFSYMLMHGESFRADPIISTCFIFAAMLLIVRPRCVLSATAAGLLMALAAMVSIKTIFYAPTIGLLLLFNWLTYRRQALRSVLAFVAVSVATVSLLLIWHRNSLPTPPLETLSVKLSGIGKRMWQPPFPWIHQATDIWDRTWWWIIKIGAIIAVATCIFGNAGLRRSAAIVLALLLPLATLDFYRNSFPYFYICLVPGAAVAAGFVAARLSALLPSRPVLTTSIIGLTVTLVGARAVELLGLNDADNVRKQRELVEVVHQLFPEPVAYIDKCSMIVNYPKVGFFMSTLVSGSYREAGMPIMESLVKEQQPKFLIENAPGLYQHLAVEKLKSSPYRLLPEDHRYLRKHYIPHWGPIRIAGQTISLAGGETATIDIPVAGPYTVESDTMAVIDGGEYHSGETLQLAAGSHEIAAPTQALALTLRYGQHTPVPSATPPGRNLFTGLGFLTED